MKVTIYFVLTALFFITSCGDRKDTEQDQLLKKVMEVHDEIMPKMSDLMKYTKQLKAQIDELTEAGDVENKDKIEELKKAVQDLENSHDGMMSWMREFDRNFEGKVQEEVMEYLNDQMTKIETVGLQTNEALKNAEKLLSE